MRGGDALNEWNFDRDRPIFRQIADKLRADIAAGRYGEGERLPSVREFALEIGANPNTIQRALSQLEAEGILETRRGDGRYVCDGDDVRRNLTETMSSELCRDFLARMRELGYSDASVIDALRHTMESE